MNMTKALFSWIIIMTNTHELQLSMFYRITGRLKPIGIFITVIHRYFV